MFYVYVLRSRANNDLYIGYSKDLKKRLVAHNSGKVKSTKPYLPWNLIYYEAYKNKYDATRRERELKQHKAKDKLREQIVNSIKI